MERRILSLSMLAFVLIACQHGATALPSSPPTTPSDYPPGTTGSVATLPGLTPTTSGSFAASEDAWEHLIAEAKSEGRVVVAGPPASTIRQTLPAAFEARYGITVEYLAGDGAQHLQRLDRERQAGLHTTDAWIQGIGTFLPLAIDAGLLDPIRPSLLDPAVTNVEDWRDSRLWFKDPDGLVVGLSGYVPQIIYINSNLVDKASLNSWQALLDPRWKGKITCQDPTFPGSGVAQALYLYLELGETFVRNLYVDQAAQCFRDARQQADALARGTFAISVGLDKTEFAKLREQRLPVEWVPSPPEAPGYLTSGNGNAALVKDAPHPKAARLFINWLLSKEGISVLGKAQDTPTLRTDVDNAWAPAEIIPRPGVRYLDLDTSEAIAKRADFQVWIRTLLAR